MSPIQFRKSVRIGPRWLNLRVNLSHGKPSFTWRLFRWLSWNSRSQKVRVDLPGPFAWSSGKPPSRRRVSSRETNTNTPRRET